MAKRKYGPTLSLDNIWSEKEIDEFYGSETCSVHSTSYLPKMLRCSHLWRKLVDLLSFIASLITIGGAILSLW